MDHDAKRSTALRHHQSQRRRKLDLRVTAPTLCAGLATVIVEIKWSDNAETRTNLVKQLANQYLLDEGKTHGIFLVGWIGKWTGGGKKSNNLQMLGDHLRQQVASLRTAERHKLLTIKPIVLDIRWSDSADPIG